MGYLRLNCALLVVLSHVEPASKSDEIAQWCYT